MLLRALMKCGRPYKRLLCNSQRALQGSLDQGQCFISDGMQSKSGAGVAQLYPPNLKTGLGQ